MWPNGHSNLPPDPSMPKRKPPSLDDGRPPRNRAPPVELGAVLRAAIGFEPSAIGFEPSSSAHGADVVDCDGLPWPAYVATNAGRYRTRLDTMRRGSGRGARPLQEEEEEEDSAADEMPVPYFYFGNEDPGGPNRARECRICQVSYIVGNCGVWEGFCYPCMEITRKQKAPMWYKKEDDEREERDNRE